jgi:hypothetical protein
MLLRWQRRAVSGPRGSSRCRAQIRAGRRLAGRLACRRSRAARSAAPRRRSRGGSSATTVPRGHLSTRSVRQGIAVRRGRSCSGMDFVGHSDARLLFVSARVGGRGLRWWVNRTGTSTCRSMDAWSQLTVARPETNASPHSGSYSHLRPSPVDRPGFQGRRSGRPRPEPGLPQIREPGPCAAMGCRSAGQTLRCRVRGQGPGGSDRLGPGTSVGRRPGAPSRLSELPACLFELRISHRE